MLRPYKYICKDEIHPCVLAVALFFLASPLAVNEINGEIKLAAAQAQSTPNLTTQAFLLNQSGVKQLN